jgi:lipopolysaccharide transport system ATP-binding protein
MSEPQSSHDFAIRVRDVTKHYVMFARPEDRLKQMIVPRLQRLAGRTPTRYFRDFAALKQATFDVRRGETVGIVGRNGSGKSTLLQVICGTLRPTSGSVEVNGRIAALLELGAGFNPEFTGRENVYLNAAILGLSRAETDARFEDIARFADIGDFIDQPVKTYSSGMYVRLAFATAINVDPDILVVDEALAVGDEAFQRKCYARIEDIQQKGGTILFVSHSAQAVVQLCSRALLVDGGEVLLDGRPKVVVSQYQRLVNLSGAEAEPVRQQLKSLDASQLSGAIGQNALDAANDVSRAGAEGQADLEGFDPNFVSKSRVDYESKGAVISNLRLVNSRGQQVNILQRRRRYTFEYVVDYRECAHETAFGMLIKAINGIELAGVGTNLVTKDAIHARAGQSAVVRMAFDCNLAPGVYFLNCGAGAVEDGQPIMLHRILDGLTFRVVDEAKPAFSGFVDLNIVSSIDFRADQNSVQS